MPTTAPVLRVALITSLLAACSDGSGSTPAPDECPAGPEAPLGAACAAEQQQCAYGYDPLECGGRTVICEGGVFVELEHTDPAASCFDAGADTGIDAAEPDAGDAAADIAPDVDPYPPLPGTWSATEADFDCLTEWRGVRGFYLTNTLGREELAVQVAEAGFVDDLPPGTIIQLVPQEAMAKLLPGTNPETGDWEFFKLTTDATGTTIVERGGAEVSNPAGSCLGCHAGAADRDLICEDTGLCANAAVPREIVDALVAGDPRCD